MSWLHILAFYFGTFLPSLPYAIFMVVVVGWVLAVIQSVVAAPLWTVMHMRPSQTFIGSDQQGYLLLLSLFVRPALAVIGLFAGILAADPIVDYLAKAFFSMRTAIVTSQESLGWIVEFITFKDWMVVFGLILLPVTYMVFGLPQVLPDHVLKWIGAGIADLGETHAAHSMRGGMERAALASAGAPPVSLPRQGGGSALGGSGSPSGPRLPPGGGGRGGQRSERGNTAINAGGQGVAPPEADMGTAPAASHQRPASTPAANRAGSTPLSSGNQGSTPESPERATLTPDNLAKGSSSPSKPINTGDATPPQGEPA